MKILALLQGGYGLRVVNTVKALTKAKGWSVKTVKIPRLSMEEALDNPEGVIKLVKDTREKVDLVLSLGEQEEVVMLLPDLLNVIRAKAVVVAVDDDAWAPTGLIRQVKKELEEIGVKAVFPKPFCSLEPVGDEVIDEFSSIFGKPLLSIVVKQEVIKEVKVIRGAPCGSTWFIAKRLIGCRVDEAGRVAGMELFRYPCYASSKWNPQRDRLHLMDLAAYITKLAVEEALEKALRGKKS